MSLIAFKEYLCCTLKIRNREVNKSMDYIKPPNLKLFKWEGPVMSLRNLSLPS